MATNALWMNAAAETLVGTVTITAADDTLTFAAHGLSNFDEVRAETLTGGAVGVLVEGAPYYVRNATTDTFQVAAAPGGPVMTFTSDGGAAISLSEPQYPAQVLRDAFSGLLQKGNFTGGFKARGGVFPDGDEDSHVAVSGTDWTVGDLTGVVAASGGPYIVRHESETNPLDPADSTNDRIDALDMQVQDDDADGSGVRQAHVVYTAGTPAASPTAPTQAPDSERLATILVPAGGSPTPSLDTGPHFTVARGGIPPVRDSTVRPATGGLYKGFAVWDIPTNRLDVNTTASSSGWEGLASVDTFTLIAAMLGWQWNHTASGITHDTDTLTALTGGPTVTVDVPDSGNVLVLWGGRVEFSEAAETPLARWRIQMSGANTTPVANTSTIWSVRKGTDSATSNYQSRHSFHVETGLTPGSTTFTSEYAISSGTATFDFRSLFVLPL